MSEHKLHQNIYEGYPKILKTLYMDHNWKFRNNSELFEKMQAELLRLVGDVSQTPYLVSEVDKALNAALDARYRFVLQHHYGLNPVLGKPKSGPEIGKIAPRADGGIGLSRNEIRIMRLIGHRDLFRYQRQNSIAGLSFNP